MPKLEKEMWGYGVWVWIRRTQRGKTDRIRPRENMAATNTWYKLPSRRLTPESHIKRLKREWSGIKSTILWVGQDIEIV